MQLTDAQVDEAIQDIGSVRSSALGYIQKWRRILGNKPELTESQQLKLDEAFKNFHDLPAPWDS